MATRRECGVHSLGNELIDRSHQYLAPLAPLLHLANIGKCDERLAFCTRPQPFYVACQAIVSPGKGSV